MSVPERIWAQSLLDYDPATGKLFWKERPVESFAEGNRGRDAVAKTWNSRFAGREAMTALDSNGYHHGNFGRKKRSAHRLAWLIATGEWPEQIDHINGIRTDNRLVNLRAVTNQTNGQNAKRREDNTSGVCGVARHPKPGLWQAYINANGKRKNLGAFDSFDKAVSVRRAAEKEFGYHENHGR